MDGKRDLDPADWRAVREQGHRMLDDLFEHLEHLRRTPVWLPVPAEVKRRFRSPIPAEPGSLAEAHAIFMRDVLPYAGGNLHPGFMGWVQGAGTPVGMLADMLAAGLNANLGGRDHMPIEVERQVIGWLRELVGFPDNAGGILLTGASMANFVGVLAARQRALGAEVRRKGLAGARLAGYASTATHACVTRAFEMAGLGTEALRLVGVGPDHRIDTAALRAAIAADRRAGLTPFLLVGNAGTVDVGAIDDLAALAAIARAEGLHFHIDGAFGALCVLTPALKPLVAGLEQADSLAFDLHKWAQVPYDAGVILVRDAALQRATFAGEAAYLQRDRRGLAGGDWWPCDDGPELSRGFRALKVWFTLKVLGADAIGAAIERSCALAKDLERRIAAAPQLELLAPVALNIVCFRYACDDADRVNRAIVADLQEAGEAAPSLTRIDGKVAIRAALFNHRSDTRDLDALVRGVVAFGDAARKGAA
ncbi:MAG TPA: pyridoxal-dependent decarboxylase [Caulobacteraceae bacterium]|nr:pyridoxal-dependent decarboxylase [Caulobacteraceae bacterium]